MGNGTAEITTEHDIAGTSVAGIGINAVGTNQNVVETVAVNIANDADAGAGVIVFVYTLQDDPLLPSSEARLTLPPLPTLAPPKTTYAVPVA